MYYIQAYTDTLRLINSRVLHVLLKQHTCQHISPLPIFSIYMYKLIHIYAWRQGLDSSTLLSFSLHSRKYTSSPCLCLDEPPPSPPDQQTGSDLAGADHCRRNGGPAELGAWDEQIERGDEEVG